MLILDLLEICSRRNFGIDERNLKKKMYSNLILKTYWLVLNLKVCLLLRNFLLIYGV
jgi:hypothetical protein